MRADARIYNSRNFVKNGNMRAGIVVEEIYNSRNFVKNGNVVVVVSVLSIYNSRNFVKNGNWGGGYNTNMKLTKKKFL